MKGMVFNEFLEMVEARFGEEMVDRIIVRADLPSGAAYTSVGTYDADEIFKLVGMLSEETGTPAGDLVRAFGRYLFARFAVGHAQFFRGVDNAFAFLKHVDRYIHVEVHKLHPDAELPTFEYRDLDDDGLEMTYRSARPLGDLAEGLIRGCIEHYGEPISLRREDLDAGDGAWVRFTMMRRAA